MEIHVECQNPDAPLAERIAAGIRIVNLPIGSDRQNIHVKTLEDHKAYIDLDDDRIVFHTLDGDVVFHILTEPGRHCLTCLEALPPHAGNGTALEARRAAKCRAHVDEHGEDAVRSNKWPHGYTSLPSTFQCRIEDRRHG